MLLLVGAGLLLRSFGSVLRVDPGFNPRDLLTAVVPLPDNRYGKDPEMRRFYRELLPRLEALPGVEAAAITMPFPYQRSDISIAFDLHDRPPAPPDRPFVAAWRSVSPGYFQMMGIRLLEGRVFERRDDDPSAPPTMVVNQAFARTYWPNGSALGQKVKAGINSDAEREIVGVVADVLPSLEDAGRAEMYAPFGQRPINGVFVAVRARNAGTLGHAVAEAVTAIDAEQPTTDIATMQELLGASLGRRRIVMVLLAIFAGFALLLAAVGIYGVISYTVTQRTRELGIRMALGAQRGVVLRMVLTQGLRAAGIGIALGAAGALLLRRVMAGLVYGISATDPATFGGIAALLAAVALVAGLLPARRATRVDPMVALRGD
jgi:putative ABC transport system permease protein